MTTAKTFKQQASIIAMISEAEGFLAYRDNKRGINPDSSRYTVTIESGGQKRDCLGTFGPQRWAGVDLESREFGTERINEIALKAEHLMREPREIYATLVHEHVHKENFDTDCKDCSASGSHNKIFKSVAEENGLTVTHGKDLPKQGFEARPGKGYAFTELSDEEWELIQSEFKPHIEVWDMARQEPAKEKKQSSSVTLKCDCLGGQIEPASITMPRGAMQTRIDGNTEIICPACNGKFIVRD
jgi:hypothetical protein